MPAYADNLALAVVANNLLDYQARLIPSDQALFKLTWM